MKLPGPKDRAFACLGELLRPKVYYVEPPFHLEPPVNGVNADYINGQTEVLQQKMEALMEEFLKRINHS